MALNGLKWPQKLWRPPRFITLFAGGSARHWQVDTTSQWPCGTVPDSADLEVDSHHIPLGSTGLSGMIQMMKFILSHKQQRVDSQHQFFSQMCAEGLPVTTRPRLNTGYQSTQKEMCQSFWATAIPADKCFNHLDDLRHYPPAWFCSHQFGHVDMLLVPEHAGHLKNVGGATTIDSDNQKWGEMTICLQKHTYIHTIHYIKRLYLHLHLHVHLHLLHYIHVCIYIYIYSYSIYNYGPLCIYIYCPKWAPSSVTQAFQDPGMILHELRRSLPRCLHAVLDWKPGETEAQQSGYPLVNKHRPWQIGVGRLVSIKNWWCSGSMLIYQGVNYSRAAAIWGWFRIIPQIDDWWFPKS